MVFTPRAQPWVNDNQSGGTALANAIDSEDLNRLESNDSDLNSRVGLLESGAGTATPLDSSVTNAKVADDLQKRIGFTDDEKKRLVDLDYGYMGKNDVAFQDWWNKSFKA